MLNRNPAFLDFMTSPAVRAGSIASDGLTLTDGFGVVWDLTPNQPCTYGHHVHHVLGSDPELDSAPTELTIEICIDPDDGQPWLWIDLSGDGWHRAELLTPDHTLLDVIAYASEQRG